MRILFLTQYDERGASSRCRVYQYLPHLARHGIEGEIIPRLPSVAEMWRRAGAADVVFLQKRVPSLTRLLALRRAHRLWFDFDDAIWLRRAADGTVRPAAARKRLRLAATLRLSHGVIAGNDYLAAYARRWNRNVALLPTPIDLDYYTPHSASRPPPSAPQLGWVGHPDNLGYLRPLEPVFAALCRRFPGLALRVVCSEPYESGSIPVENVLWSLAEEVANLRALDIGLMPLEEDPWTRGKCGYKALQYMAAGVPVVCSPVGMNTEIVTDGENGLLAAGPADWERQIARLIAAPELRHRLGAAGRRSVEEHYSLAVMAERLAGLLME